MCGSCFNLFNEFILCGDVNACVTCIRLMVEIVCVLDEHLGPATGEVA